MPRQAKLGNSRGVREWRALASVGDVKRLLAWCVHSMQDGTLDRQDAAVLAQIANTLLRGIEGYDIEKRLEEMERRYAALQKEP